MSDERRRQYATAFYAQAVSDWEVYERLLDSLPGQTSLPPCHSLHYLQMACEKLGKAWRLRTPGAHVDTIITRHVGFAQFMKEFLRSPSVTAEYKGRDAAHRNVSRTSATIAREIEKLAPATDRTATPENSEYPWERGDWAMGTGEVLVPCRYPYPTLSLLSDAGVRAFIKLVRRAFRDWHE